MDWREPFASRRQRTSTYNKIHQLLADLRIDRISPVDSSKLMQLVDMIMADRAGHSKLLECMRPHLEEFACETVADEMATRRRNSIVSGIAVVTPDFIEKWSLDEEVDHSPFLTSILIAAAQTERAKIENKIKNPEKMVQVVTRQLLYQFSNNCLAFQAEFGLFLRCTGCARQTIDALSRCGLSVADDSVLNLVKSLGEHCNPNAVRIVATDPTGLGYGNINISTSIFVEQRGSGGPAKVTSGTLEKSSNSCRRYALDIPP
ncbi:hypothetical protein B0H14DRAFT_2640736 [Mycena olivaceomarginata]|nr:hypothetical protein B0H14DRAFT_2640736 [Mycena olivaceomarginata]